jgi:D-inositol-3-phosphate glycosyltransferase
MKLILVGDAVVQTGFARVTHNVCGHLAKRGWDIHVLGVNYMGDPHEYPYKVYPAGLGGDSHGVNRLPDMIRGLKPDVVLIINDPWIIRDYLNVLQGCPVPVVAYMPVDAPNQEAAADLVGLARAISYTNFGKKELTLGGYNGRCDVIPHGVDLEMYRPIDRIESRRRLKFKVEKDIEKLFIVGNVNRNQPRKRLDLTIQYFTQWWTNAGQPSDAHLYLHCSNRDEGWNVIKLAEYFGITSQFIITNPRMTTMNCLKEADMPYVYSMFDVQLSTSMGEGWGLTTHEGMACGVPQIVPKYSALGEWARDAVHYVDCTNFEVTPKGINTIGGVPDRDQTIAAIDKFYRDHEYKKVMAEKALSRAREAQFNWAAIGEQFHLALLETAVDRQRKPVGVEAPE